MATMKGGERDKGGSRATAIELQDSDTEDEGSVTQSLVTGEPQEHKSDQGDAVAQDGRASGSTLPSLLADRAQMERERIERQKKRRRDAGLPEEEDEGGQSAPKKAAKGSMTRGGASAPLYWTGTVKKSYNEFSRAAPGTPFAHFLLPTTPFNAAGLTHAVLATYCADLQWLACLFPKAPTQQNPQITFICMEERELKAGVHAPMHPSLPNWVRLVVPRSGLTEYTTMHMKFVLLFYEDRIRLMILSGNMIEYDWKVIENTAFIHDFPRLPIGQTDTTSEYGTQMRAVLKSLSVPPGHPALAKMSSYDMRTTCEARIVASIPTSKPITGWSEMEHVGLARLAKVVKDILGGKARKGVSLEAQGSSMGLYSTRWLQQFHIISSGIGLPGVLPLPPAARASKAWAQAVTRKESEKWPPIKLLFPSDRWVKTQSIQGPLGALTFFGKARQSVEKGFIDILYQPVSVRGNFMMHHKAIVALQPGAEEETEDDKPIGWTYMGSHNLTQAAWGNISQPRAGTEPQCTIGNWELGVVMPLRRRDLDESQRLSESARMAANIITWQRPAEKYRSGDVPWDQTQQDASPPL